MEQPLAPLKLEANKLKELKVLGYEYIPRNNALKEFFDGEDYENLTKAPKTKTALDLYREYSNDGTICTFIRGLDSVLEDEIVPGNIIELCGEPGSGKTQICFQLCVNVQLPTILGGRNGESLYICSNYNFSRRRIEEIATSTVQKLSKVNLKDDLKLSTNEILSKITHIQVGKYEELIAIVIYLKTLLKTKRIRVIVIDSITVLFQQIEYKYRKCVLYTLFSDLQKLAEEYNFVIFVTNEITTRNTSRTEISKTSALGENFYHRVNARVELSCLTKNYYKVVLVKSVCNTKKEGFFSF